MKKVKYGVFYARFEPFTRGHLDTCLQILEQHDELVVGVSNPLRKVFDFSPEVSPEARELKLSSLMRENNPFNFWQRMQMIRDSLAEAKADLARVSIVAKPPTFEANPVWHDAIPPRPECVIYLPFSYKHHYENARIHQQEHWRLVDISGVLDYSGKESLNLLGQGKWNDAKKLMPKAAVRLARGVLEPADEKKHEHKNKPRRKYGIFYGRFQPFHNGHLAHCLNILKNNGGLVAGVTNPFLEQFKFHDKITESGRNSKMESLQPENNPFTFWDRYQMVRNSLLGEGIKPKRFCIVAKPSTLSEAGEWTEVFPPREESEVYLAVKDPHHFDAATIYRSKGWKVTIAAPVEGYSGKFLRSLMRERKWNELKGYLTNETLEAIKEAALLGRI
ncbi:hypothetical protein HY546_01050 [archaeon]|nr:hypothetical protein [archaeon]